MPGRIPGSPRLSMYKALAMTLDVSGKTNCAKPGMHRFASAGRQLRMVSGVLPFSPNQAQRNVPEAVADPTLKCARRRPSPPFASNNVSGLEGTPKAKYAACALHSNNKPVHRHTSNPKKRTCKNIRTMHKSHCNARYGDHLNASTLGLSQRQGKYIFLFINALARQLTRL